MRLGQNSSWCCIFTFARYSDRLTLKASISGLQASISLPLLSYTTSKSPEGIALASDGLPHTILAPCCCRLSYWLKGALLLLLPCTIVFARFAQLQDFVIPLCMCYIQLRPANLVTVVENCHRVSTVQQLPGQVQAYKSMASPLGVCNQNAVCSNMCAQVSPLSGQCKPCMTSDRASRHETA